MTIVQRTNGKIAARGEEALMKDVIAALEAAGVNDPMVVDQVVESLVRAGKIPASQQ